MQPVIDANYQLVRDQPALVQPRVVGYISRLYDYRLMQLRDLHPNTPNVNQPPYHGLPPPHLLLGYQYMHRTLNDYLFENRIFMQLSYELGATRRPQRLHWNCLTDCSYSLTVGDYMRFLDLDNFHDSFEQMHNAVLMDRVRADMRQANLRGSGADALDLSQHDHLTGAGAANLHNSVLDRLASANDASLLAAIRRLRVALCHYLFLMHYERLDTLQQYQFLPGSVAFTYDEWIQAFVDTFADLDTQSLVATIGEDPAHVLDDEPTEIMTRCLIQSLAAPSDELAGGAHPIRLRNRTVPARPGLRPRNPQGRAITSSQMRRRRRRAIQAFVDRLPVTRRRPRPPPERPPSPRPGPSRELEPEEWEAMEEEEPEREAEDEEERLFQEVVQTIMEAIEALQTELSGVARRHSIFQFATAFYRLLLVSREAGMVTPSFIRKWVLYFFLCEHMASTLYYLHSRFILNRNFRRYCDLPLAQVLLRGWDVNAQPIFKRIWSEQLSPQQSAHVFETLWERILRDCLMMVERTGQFIGLDESDQQIFLSDIQYRDRSGDIEEVLNQLNLSEELIENIEISFRIKVKGTVAITTNQQIKDVLRRNLRP